MMNAHTPVPGIDPGLRNVTFSRSDLQDQTVELEAVLWTIQILALEHGDSGKAQSAIISLAGIAKGIASHLKNALDSVNEVI